MSRSTSQDPEKFGVGPLFWLTHEAIVGADVSTEQITLWNPSATRIFGYSESEAVGMKLESLVPSELKDSHHAGIRRYRETGEARLVGGSPVELPAITKSGEKIFVSLTLTALPETDGRNFVLAVIRDVTQQKAAEQDLRRMNEAMEAFVATASHDLRTPLASILGFARILLERGGELEEQQRQDFSAAILRGGEQASRLVDDLLTLSKIQAQAIEVRTSRISVMEAAAEAARDAGVPDVQLSIDPKLNVTADADHLRRILVNYLSNARDHGAPPVGFSAESASEWTVEIRVCDAGDGVPESFRERLFTPFARVGKARGVAGTGLGLAIVKGLAEASGGAVFYENSEGRSCFGVRLPAA